MKKKCALLFIVFAVFCRFISCEEKLLLEVKVTNLSDSPSTFSFRVSRCMVDFNGFKDWDFLPLLGYAGKDGLSAEKPGQEKWLNKNENSGWMKMPAYGKVLHVYNEGTSPPDCAIEVRIKNQQQQLQRIFLWKDKPEVFHIYMYFFPESAKSPVLILKTAEEFIKETREYIQQEMKNFPIKKTPELIVFSTDFNVQQNDNPDWIKENLLLLRQLGLNCVFDSTNSIKVSQLIKDTGFLYVDHWGLSSWPITYEGFDAKKKEYETTALRTLDTYFRSINRENVKVLHGDDEISSGSLEDFIALDSQVQNLVIDYFKKMRVPLADIGVKDYCEVRLIPDGTHKPYTEFLKTNHQSLFYWINKARMEYVTDLIAETVRITEKYYPHATIISPNWPAAGVLGGGYDGHGWDFWLVYRKKGLKGIYGEPTPWYNFYLQGIFSWYGDMMRSHIRNGPMGAYITTARGSYPCFLNHFEVYELAARGVEHFHWYSYGGMWGNENYTNDIVRDLLKEFAIVHREFAEAEEYLYRSIPEKADVAILWTPEQEIWDASLHQELVALYLLLLHSNYHFDIISSYDVDDGLLKNYKVLYMPFAYIERKTFDRIKEWVLKGGKLIVDGGFLKDEYNNSGLLEDFLQGYHSTVEKKINIGSLAHLRNHVLLDQATNSDSSIIFPVICQKVNMKIPEKARVVLAYKDGKPAAFEIDRGKGKVLVSGFLFGVAYQRDEEDKDNPDWSKLPVGHNFSPFLRNFVTKFIKDANIKKVCNIEQDLIVARKRIKGQKQIITVFDYHFGKPVNELVFPEWPYIGETIVKVDIGNAKSAKSVRGSLIKRDGKYVWVKFKGMDFILVD
ncbi:MAG TPA: hypothetical protein PK303_01290 [bacterium]|nr:hypothetical protein [bacterium]HOL35453.1 hypothetical protein [bacterium]HPP07741.1 hypothetical protein [bacterium]